MVMGSEFGFRSRVLMCVTIGLHVACQPTVREVFAYILAPDFGLGVYRIHEDGRPVWIQDVPGTRVRAIAMDPSGRFLLGLDGQALISFRVEPDGLLSEVDREPMKFTKAVTMLGVSGGSVYAGINDSSTGEGYTLFHLSLSDAGMLAFSDLPVTSVCPFAQRQARTGDILLRRDGAMHIPLQRSNALATAVAGRSRPGLQQNVTYLQTVRHPDLPASERHVGALAHPLSAWVFWGHSRGIGTFRTATPPQNPLEKVSEIALSGSLYSFVVEPSGRRLYASTTAGIESFEISPEGLLSADRLTSAPPGTLTINPNGSGLYLSELRSGPGGSLRFFHIASEGELRASEWSMKSISQFQIGGEVTSCFR